MIVGIGTVTLAPQTPISLLCTISAGQVSTGSSLSTTVTLNIQVDVFPSLSVTESVTAVVPTGKAEPLAGVATISPEMFPSSVSVAVPAKLDTAVHTPGSVLIMISAGQVITGASPIIVIPVIFNPMALTPPLSPPALSVKRSIQSPLGSSPLKVLNKPNGSTEPAIEGTAGLQTVSTSTAERVPPSSNVAKISSTLHPKAPEGVGSPGSSISATIVPAGDSSSMSKSPSHVWVTSKSMVKSVILPESGTLMIYSVTPGGTPTPLSFNGPVAPL